MPSTSRPRAALAVLALVLTTSASAAAAQILPGSRLTFTGTASALDIGPPGVILDFQPGVVAGTSGNTGTFASLNRSTGAGVVGTIADLLVGKGPQAIPSFLVFGAYRFDLQALPSGPFGQEQCYLWQADPAPGQLCTPYQSVRGNPLPTDPLSPFYMANILSGDPSAPTLSSIVAFNLIGTVTGPRGATSNFFGTISTLFPAPYQYVLLGLEGAGDMGRAQEGITFTGNFFAGDRAFRADEVIDQEVAPEPATVALVGAGLAVVAGAARRRRRA